jgi:hypothetical protein
LVSDVPLADWRHPLGAEDDVPEFFVHVEDVVGAVLSGGPLVVGSVLEVVELDIRDLASDEALTEVVLTVIVAMGDQWELMLCAAVKQRDGVLSEDEVQRWSVAIFLTRKDRNEADVILVGLKDL